VEFVSSMLSGVDMSQSRVWAMDGAHTNQVPSGRMESHTHIGCGFLAFGLGFSCVENKVDFYAQVGRIRSEYDELHCTRYRIEYAFLRPHGGYGEFEDGVCMRIVGLAVVERVVL